MFECSHGNAGSCPEDRLCQMRLRWGWGIDPRGADDDWQTHSVYACDANTESWRRQVGPVLRRRNYETRVVRVADAA